MISGCISGRIPEPTRGVVAFPENVLGKIAMPASGDIIRATANITIDSHEGKYSGKTALLLKMPSCLRVETMPVFGPSDFFLSASEESLKVFFPGEGKFYVGSATRENLFLFFRIFLSPGDMVSILAGRPPQIMEGSLSEHVDGGLYRIDIRNGKRTRLLWINPDDYTLTKIEEIYDGRVVYRATFEGHIAVNKILYPERISIEVNEPERVSMDVRYLDIDILSDGNTTVFDLQTPSGITPVFVD